MRVVWCEFFQTLGFLLAWNRESGDMIEKFLLALKGQFLLLIGVCTILWDIWGKQNNHAFKGLKENPSEMWSCQISCFPLSFNFKHLL